LDSEPNFSEVRLCGAAFTGVEQSTAARRELSELLPIEPKVLDQALDKILDVVEVYRENGNFLWRTLQHLGIRDADLEDVMQEVLVVVHRRRESYRFSCRLTTWLFGICLRVASRHRRRAYLRWERDESELPELTNDTTPEAELAERQAEAQFKRHLAKLNLEQRATFVMFEIEGHSCQEIAALFAVPLGTIHSRLHAARQVMQAAFASEKFPVKGGPR
jgi:RNA polymerase sigma-70 factor, ECF subfamily